MRRFAAVVLALAVVAACSSGSSSSGATGSPSPRASAPSADFCKEIVESHTEQTAGDPNSAKQVLAVLHGLTPPDEIKGDWSDYLGALDELSRVDQSDRAAYAQIAARHAKSLSAVSLYISNSCRSFASS